MPAWLKNAMAAALILTTDLHFSHISHTVSDFPHVMISVLQLTSLSHPNLAQLVDLLVKVQMSFVPGSVY